MTCKPPDFKLLLVWHTKARLLFFPCVSEWHLKREIARQKRFNRLEGIPGWHYEVREYKRVC